MRRRPTDPQPRGNTAPPSPASCDAIWSLGRARPKAPTPESDRELHELIARRLEQARGEVGLGVAQAAARLEVTPGVVGGWERGTQMPRATELAALSRLYRCSADYLIGATAHSEALPVDCFFIDHGLVQSALSATSESELEDLVDWDPQMMTFWHVVRRSTRIGTTAEVADLSRQLAAHVKAVAPRLWAKFQAARRRFRHARALCADSEQ